MNELAHTLQEIPLAALIPLAIAIVIGLLLWAAGRRILRLGFAAIGLLIGLSVGWVAGEAFNFGIPSWAVGVIGGTLVAAVAVVLYRVALASSLAIVFGIAAPLGTIAAYELQGHQVFIERGEALETKPKTTPDHFAEPDPEAEPDGGETEEPWWERELKNQARKNIPASSREVIDHNITPETFDYTPEITDQIERLRLSGGELLGALRGVWNSTTESIRPTLTAATVGGLILGFVIGALLPGFSAAFVTAFGGSLLWISAGRILTERLTLGDMGVLPATGRGWIALWLIVALIGLCIQWTIERKRADKSA